MTTGKDRDRFEEARRRYEAWENSVEEVAYAMGSLPVSADIEATIYRNVQKLPQDDELWKKLWYLHCCDGVQFRNTPVTKVYESATVSLAFQ